MTRSTGMNKSAPFGVFRTLLIAPVAGCATGDMARTPLVAPSPVYAQDEVTYEYQWLAGKAVIIAAAGLVKVTALLIPNKELPSTMCALLVLENGSDAPMLFSPQNLLVRAMDTTGEHSLKVYSPEEYETMMKPSKTWWTVLGLLAARDYPAVPGIIENRMQAADATFQQRASVLLRKQTLAPNSRYWGVVGFENRRTNQYRLYVPFGPKSFTLTFDMP